jgi:hypothetical protein
MAELDKMVFALSLMNRLTLLPDKLKPLSKKKFL